MRRYRLRNTNLIAISVGALALLGSGVALAATAAPIAAQYLGASLSSGAGHHHPSPTPRPTPRHSPTPRPPPTPTPVPTATPTTTPTPTPSPTPSPTPDPGQYQVAKGIYVFTGVAAATTVVPAVANGPFPGVTGYDFVVYWASLESAPGIYTWTTLDNAISLAAAAGKTVQIAVIPGEGEPSWAVSSCPDITLRLDNQNKLITMCNPTSSQFLSMWTTFIAAFGAHYSGMPDVVSVQSTGLGDQGEMTLSPLMSGTWAGDGITNATLIAGWEQVVTAWHNAMPGLPVSLAIEEPLLPKPSAVLPTLLPWIQSTYGSEVMLQQNGLTSLIDVTTTPIWADIKAASAWTEVGWQMFGSGALDGDLQTALQYGLESNGSYYQVYPADLENPAMTSTLQWLSSQLQQAPVPTADPNG